MKKIISDLNIGRSNSGLDMFCDLTLNEQHLYRMKCESFVANLMKYIRLCMTGHREPKYWNTQYGERNITAINVKENGDVDITVDNWIDYNGGNVQMLCIQGVHGLEGLNGQFSIHEGETPYIHQRISRYNWRIKGIAPSVTGEWDGASGIGIGSYHKTEWWDSYQRMPLRWFPIIGTDGRPVKASDLCLPGYFKRGCNQGNVSLSSVLTDQKSSKFTISRPFTNESGVIKQIAEIGLKSALYGNDMLMARDVLGSPVNLDHASTLSLDYEILSEIENFNQDTDLNGSNGGWTEQFMHALHRCANPNASHTYGVEWNLACGLGGGGTGISPGTSTNVHAWQFGVRLGEDNKFVSMTDTNLTPDDNNKHGISHGYEDGLLVHHGMHIGDLVIDDVANEVYFPVERIFENRGATPITVREIGLYGNRTNSNAYSPRLLARRALAEVDQFTIQPGESVKVGFNCKAVV